MARVCLTLTTMPDLDQIEGNLKILVETNKGVKLSETIKLQLRQITHCHCQFIVNPRNSLDQGKFVYLI